VNAKVISALVGAGGIIHVEDRELPPGPAQLVVLYPENGGEPAEFDLTQLPLGGHRAGWIQPTDLRREAMYEED